MSNAETALQRAILERLAHEPDLLLFRNLTGQRKGYKFGLYNAKYRRGSSDLIGSLRGLFVAIEVKLPGEKPTPEQLEFMAAIEANGGFAAVVCSVNEAVEAVRKARECGAL